MAILRHLNEFGLESTVWELSPARGCVASCTYCFAELNARVQKSGKSRNLVDDGSFESNLTRAYSDSYDPSNFMQWSLRNRIPICFSNSVEPFQNISQSRAILRTLDKFSIPLWIQTKTLNLAEVYDELKPFHDNSSILISFPTDDDQIIKRFEPGTPRASSRIAAIEKLSSMGFHVTLGLSPYHPEWNESPSAFVSRMHSAGISSVFFDRLHLSQRQRKAVTDPVMLSLASRTESGTWDQQTFDHYQAIWETCRDLSLPIYCGSMVPQILGLPNTSVSVTSPDSISRGTYWTYHDGLIHHNLFAEFHDDIFCSRYDSDPESYAGQDSLLITWSTILSLIEQGQPISQPFAYSSLSDLLVIKNLPAPWISHLKPSAPISEYFRALWNSPSRKQFVWRNPLTRIAMRPDGSPYTDPEGNIIMLYDPWFSPDPGMERIEPSLSSFSTLEVT
jgi:DNA repair photolyase